MISDEAKDEFDRHNKPVFGTLWIDSLSRTLSH
jgi:hypothetical protein